MKYLMPLMPAKLSSLLATIRNEGWHVALLKTRDYFARRRSGPSIGATGQNGTYLIPFWRDIAGHDAFHVSAAPATLSKRRRITMIGDLNLPQCRKYRVEQPQELWQALGVSYEYAHYEDVPRAVALLQDATHVMFYRTQNRPLTSMLLYEARRLRLPVLYDLDDPLFSVSAYETYQNMAALPAAMKTHFVREAPLYLDAMNMADIITVSTPGMRDHTLSYTNRPVHFRRNFADNETLTAAMVALTSLVRNPVPFRVAFASGSMGHEVDFALIAEDIVAFLDAAPDRQLVILGHFDENLLPEALRPRVESHPFTDYASYLATLASVDCAVMPLSDDIFNHCKSAVRVIDASSVAVPSLVGDVSDMAVMVRDGETGRVLGPGASWREALEALAADRAGTAAMGQAARADLLASWTARPIPPVAERAIIDWVMA